MHFDGQFRVPGAPPDVLARFADVERMASCMPGAGIEGRGDDGHYLGSMLVAFGPKKIKFKGKVYATTDPEALAGTLHVRGAAQMKTAARAEVRIAYTLTPDAAAVAGAPGTVVTLSSDAQMGGVLADFARTGGEVVTRALMDEFAQRIAEEFARDVPAAVPNAALAAADATSAADSGNAPAPAVRRSPAAALSAHSLLWRMVKAKLVYWWRRASGRADDDRAKT